ncbi:TRAP transporter small permease [Herbaspirillum sp. RTI4]|uniref:TRAP transporter small permease n=1 Tax=Herbaspirillum sp. RTI4 TaxID=3048640 RepID=UPI002AB450AB|nr:TRAP transporter small permease [Herbaspirillum sp. RTI4]MDY7580063.1 TRAP transporter small permease [Herbaspirillum sp. RTI4]MEA9983290.1 TRAP transporter small permease [Herbaspirillum sp. RTI4]
MFNKFLDHLEEWIIATLIATATFIIFLSVVHRFASGVPAFQDFTSTINMSWAQEACIFMFVWMAKFGAAYGVRAGTHVGVDVLVNRLGPANRRKLILAGLLGGVIFTSVVGTLGASFVWQMAHTEQTSEEMEIPMWIVYLCVPLGSYLMCYRFVQVVVSFWRTGELPHRDHTQVDGIDPIDLNQIAAEVDAKNKGAHS